MIRGVVLSLVKSFSQCLIHFSAGASEGAYVIVERDLGVCLIGGFGKAVNKFNHSDVGS